MKWILIVLGIIAGLVAVVAIIGMLVPRKHVASRTAKYQQSADTVWETITDFESAPAWRTDLKTVERLPDLNGHAVWAEISRQGRMPYEVTVSEPPNQMVLRIVDDKLPFGGTWTYEIAATEDGGSTLTITENGEIYNPIFRFMARFIFGYHGTMETYLKDLGRKFGEEPVISPNPGEAI